MFALLVGGMHDNCATYGGTHDDWATCGRSARWSKTGSSTPGLTTGSTYNCEDFS